MASNTQSFRFWACPIAHCSNPTVNDNELLKLASRLRGGIECAPDSSDHLGRSRMGGMHVHLRIVLVDGVVWLARILRLNSTSFSDFLTNQILESDCATLKWQVA